MAITKQAKIAPSVLDSLTLAFACVVKFTDMDRDKLLNEVLAVVKQHKALHINDPGIYQCWSKYAELLSSDIENTKWVLLNVGCENLYRISEAFEDIAVKLKSRDFIEFLNDLNDKYPQAEMKADIEAAEQAIEPQKFNKARHNQPLRGLECAHEGAPSVR